MLSITCCGRALPDDGPFINPNREPGRFAHPSCSDRIAVSCVLRQKAASPLRPGPAPRSPGSEWHRSRTGRWFRRRAAPPAVPRSAASKHVTRRAPRTTQAHGEVHSHAEAQGRRGVPGQGAAGLLWQAGMKFDSRPRRNRSCADTPAAAPRGPAPAPPCASTRAPVGRHLRPRAPAPPPPCASTPAPVGRHDGGDRCDRDDRLPGSWVSGFRGALRTDGHRNTDLPLGADMRPTGRPPRHPDALPRHRPIPRRRRPKTARQTPPPGA
jgi:hypothetical protein